MKWKVTEGTQCLPLACIHTAVCIFTHTCIANTHEYMQILRKRNSRKKLLQLRSLHFFPVSCVDQLPWESYFSTLVSLLGMCCW